MSTCWPVTRGALTLRDAVEDDVAVVGAWRNDPRVTRWLVRPEVSVEALRRELLTPGATEHPCVVEQGGEVVGIGYLELVDDGAHPDTPRGVEALIGCLVRPDRWGQGIATALASELVAAAFERLGARRVKASCFRADDASVRVLEAVGMRREDHGVEERWHADRGWVDGYGYAMLVEEHRGAAATGGPGVEVLVEHAQVRDASATVVPRRPLPSPPTALPDGWRSERLTLAPAGEADLAQVVEWRNAPEVGAWMLRDRVRLEDLRAAFLGKDARSLVARYEGETIGTCSITIGDGTGQPGGPTGGCEAEIGYSLAPWLHGQGLGREIAAAGIDVCFDVLGVRRVTAGLYLDNLPSARLLAGLGMRLEQHGVRDSWHPRHGWVDGGRYAVLAREWRHRS